MRYRYAARGDGQPLRSDGKICQVFEENLSRGNRAAQTAHARLGESRSQAYQALAACRCNRSKRAGKIEIRSGHSDQSKVEYCLHPAPRPHRDLATLHGNQGADGKRPGGLVSSRRNQRQRSVATVFQTLALLRLTSALFRAVVISKKSQLCKQPAFFIALKAVDHL